MSFDARRKMLFSYCLKKKVNTTFFMIWISKNQALTTIDKNLISNS